MANSTIGTLVKGDTPLPVRRVLTVAERDSLKKAADVFGYGQVAGDNYSSGAQGAAPVNVPWLSVKRPKLNEQQAQVLKVLRDQSPEPTTPEDRDRIEKRCAELKDRFMPFLQTTAELRAHSHRDPVFLQALKKARDWDIPQKVLNGMTPGQICEEYRNLRRRQDPENPESDSLEDLRRSK